MEDTNNRLRIFNIINELPDIYRELDETDNNLIEESKKSFITLNDVQYSFFYLIRKKFFFINKNDVKLSISFNMKSINNKIFYCFTLHTYSGDDICRLNNCNSVFCLDNRHYYKKSWDACYNFKTEDLNILMPKLESKLNDYKICTDCMKVWDLDTENKIKNIDNFSSELCDCCNMTTHLNSKTKEKIDDCSICLKPMYKNYHIKTNCDHLFHKACIRKWYKTNNDCPLCRTVINIQT